MILRLKFPLAFAASFAATLVPAGAQQDTAHMPFMNPQLAPEERATDLVHRMTLAEKASEMQNNSAAVRRLSIPTYQWWSEALHGVLNEGVTEYSEPVGLAPTFDPAGIHALEPLLSEAGVGGSVVVQARQTVEETHWLLATIPIA